MDASLIDAKKALQNAESHFAAGDIAGATHMALKAKRLFPNLHGLAAHLESYRIHSVFDPKFPNRTDWYSILNIKPSSDLETARRRFKDLRSLTHPDKNSSSAAEGAFKLVYKAWEYISKELESDPASSSTSGGATGGATSSKKDQEEKEQRGRSASPEKKKCPDCGRQCSYIDSRGTVVECKRCGLIAMRAGGKLDEGFVFVIRNGLASIEINEGINTDINVHGGDTKVNGANAGVHVYGGGSILLNRCKGVEIKGGDGIQMNNCTGVNIYGTGNLSYG